MNKAKKNFLYDTLVDKGIWIFLAGILIIFIMYPLLCIVHKSLFTDGLFTLEHYKNLFTDNLVLMEHSLFTAVWASALSTLLGVLVAVQIAVSKGRMKLILTGILLITMVSPPFISSLVYIQLFGRRGLITYSLLGLSLNPYNKWGIIMMQSLHFASLNALFTIGILQKVDANLIYASRDLGASPQKTFTEIVLPLIRPAVFVCLILSFIRSLSDFGTPMVIGGRYNTLASEIYMQLIGYARLEKASAMNMLLFIPAVFIFLLYRRAMKRADAMLISHGGREGNSSLPVKPGGILGVAVSGASILFFTMMILQYACIFISGFLKSRKGVYYFSMEHFNSLLAYNMDSLIRSVWYALIVGVFGTIFGMVFTYYLERRKVKLGGFYDFLATLPYLLPGTCFGIGYILAFNKGPLRLTGTAAIIIINMTFKQLPTITKMCAAALSQLSERVEEAAGDLGASPFHVLKDIVLPNLKITFVTGFIYNFTSAMTTAGAVLFLISANHKVAVYTLFDAINSGKYGVASLISSMIILITLGVSGLMYALVLRRKR